MGLQNKLEYYYISTYYIYWVICIFWHTSCLLLTFLCLSSFPIQLHPSLLITFHSFIYIINLTFNNFKHGQLDLISECLCFGLGWVELSFDQIVSMLDLHLKNRFAGVYHLYMLNVKLWYGRWSAWRPYKFQRWCLQQTVLNWWKWCLHRQNVRRSLHTWRSFYDVRNSFLTLLSSIYRGRKILWRTNWHAVLRLRHLLWFILIMFPRSGSRIRNLPSFLAFCCKKKKNRFRLSENKFKRC